MNDLKDFLKFKNFKFKKALGQNFILNEKVLENIVLASGADEESTVVEIGCGAGTLTGAIARHVGKVIGFEVDKTLEPVLQENLKDYVNVDIVYKDIMKVKREEVLELAGGKYFVIANLPYYITAPIISKFLDWSDDVLGITVTVQNEVADRLVAAPSTKEYGVMTIICDAVGVAEKKFFIGRREFYPSPDVDSAVVDITMDKTRHDIEDWVWFQKVVKGCFASRRKTLVNNLMLSFGQGREKAQEMVSALGLDLTVRGENLSTEDYVKLSKMLRLSSAS